MHKPNFDIFHIYPSVENAKSVIDLRYGDLVRSGMSYEQAEQLADSNNESHVEQQLKNLEEYPERYLGAIAIGSGDWVGYSNTSEWMADDLLPYCGDIERFVFKAIIKFTGHRLIDRPLGLHELVVVDDVTHRRDIIDALVARAIAIAENRELYTAQYDDEKVLESLYINRFETAAPRKELSGGQRNLYVRPYPSHEPDYGYRKGISKTLR